eukprot:143083_1
MNMTLEVAQQAGITNDYIKRNRYKRLKDNTVFVQGCFLVLAKKHERISLSDEPKSCVTTIEYGTKTLIPVLCSNSVNPKTETDGHELGSFVLPMYWSNRHVVTEFHFYGTMFTVSWHEQNGSSKKRKEKLQINYGK